MSNLQREFKASRASDSTDFMYEIIDKLNTTNAIPSTEHSIFSVLIQKASVLGKTVCLLYPCLVSFSGPTTTNVFQQKLYISIEGTRRFFFFTRFSLRILEGAAQHEAARPLDPPTRTAFCLDEVSNVSN